MSVAKIYFVFLILVEEIERVMTLDSSDTELVQEQNILQIVKIDFTCVSTPKLPEVM